MQFEKQQGVDAQAGDEKKRHSQLEALVPAKAIEPWMREIAESKAKLIPKELREKMGNPFVFAAVAHVLKASESIKHNQDQAAIVILQSLLEFAKSKNYNDRLLEGQWVPQLDAALKRTEGMEYQHAYAAHAMRAVTALVSNPNFKQGWIEKLWEPAFERAMQSKQELEPFRIMDAFGTVASAPGFQEAWMGGIFWPGIEKIMQSVPEEKNARDEAIKAFSALFGAAGFNEGWLEKYWKPLFEKVMEKSMSPEGTAEAFSGLASIIASKNFQERHFDAMFAVLDKALEGIVGSVLGVLEAAMEKAGGKSLQKEFMPAFLRLIDLTWEHAQLYREKRRCIFDGLYKFAWGKEFEVSDIEDAVIPAVEKILKEAGDDKEFAKWGIGAFFTLMGKDGFEKSWIKKYWQPTLKYSAENSPLGPAFSLKAILELCDNVVFRKEWLDRKSSGCIVEDAVKLAQRVAQNPASIGRPLDDVRDANNSLVMILSDTRLAADYGFYLPALERILGASQIVDGEQASILIRCFDGVAAEGKLKGGKFEQFLQELGEFAPQSHVETAGFMTAYFCAGVQACKSAGERVEKIRAMLAKFKELGIENYQRYGPRVLEDIYLTATDPEYSKNKKVAFVVLNKNDNSGAFDSDRSIYEKLIDNGYCLALCEAGNEDEIAQRYFNWGMGVPAEGGNSESGVSALSGRQYGLVILGGHGSQEGINFGGLTRKGGKLAFSDETADVDLGDMGQNKMWEKGAWSKMLTNDADICLFSCSTGKEAQSSPDSTLVQGGEFLNMKRMMYALAYREGARIRVFAPQISTITKDIIFENGRVKEVKYGDADAGTVYGFESR